MFTNQFKSYNGQQRGWFNPSDENSTIGAAPIYGYFEVCAGSTIGPFAYTSKNDTYKYFVLSGFGNYVAIPNSKITIGAKEYTVINSLLATLSSPNGVWLYVEEDISSEAGSGTIDNVYYSTRLFATFADNENTKIKNRAVFPVGHVKLLDKNISLEELSNGVCGVVTIEDDEDTKVVSNTSVTANSRILLTVQSTDGSMPAVGVSTRTPGTSFTIKKGGYVTNMKIVVYWEIKENGK
jgi:hypothetical protein